jgi:hypothetical protein
LEWREYDFKDDFDVGKKDDGLKIAEINNFIDSWIDEGGKPPDEDTIIEVMGFTDEQDLVREACTQYWNRK